MKKFQSNLLNSKRALVDMHGTPTFLPPSPMRRHLDEEEQEEATLGVMEGVKDEAPRRPRQIDPRINPDGVRAGKRANAPVTVGQMQEFLSNYSADVPLSVVSAAHESIELPIWEMWGEGRPVVSVNTDPFHEYVQQLGKRSSKSAANPNLTVNNGRRKTPAPPLPESEKRPIDPFVEWFVNEVRDGRTFRTIEEAQAEFNALPGKQADYTDADFTDELAHEEERSQIDEGKALAKRHFMEEDYLQQEAMERGLTMDDLWKEIGEEYMAEFYGYSYTPPKPKPEGWRSQYASGARCPVCGSARVKAVEGGRKTGSRLIECLKCRGVYSLPRH